MKYTSIIGLLIALLWLGCGQETAEQSSIIRPVRYGKVTTANEADQHTFSGTAQSAKIAKLSFRVPGTLRDVNVKVGQKVSRGQRIASIDAVDYSIQADQAQAQIKSAQTQVKNAQTQLTTSKSNYERIEKLYENNSLPLSDYEGARANYEGAQAQYNSAVAQLQSAEKQAQSANNQVSYTRLQAPFSGIITNVTVEPNEMIPSGNPVAILEGEGNVEVVTGLPESFISRIKTGQKVSVQFSTLSDQEFSATVSEVAFSAGSGTTYPVTVKLDKIDPQIRPGMAAAVTFFFGTGIGNGKLIAPVKAIGEGPDGKFVFVLKSDGENYKVHKTQIETGDLRGYFFEVNQGLSEGDLVATAGLKSLLDGMQVKLMD